MSESLIREYCGKTDLAGLTTCLIELQDFARGMDGRMPAGNSFVNEHIPYLLKSCEKYYGKILIAGRKDYSSVLLYDRILSD